MDRIYIPTVNRVENQITYNCLPDELKKKVIMVVQAWEADQYDYPCEYLILPKDIDVDSHPRPLAFTKDIIYEHGKDSKYCMFDDDIKFLRRNAKYWTGESNMEKSKRLCTDDDMLEMFEQFTNWLDEPDVTIASCGHVENPPQNKAYSNNSSVGSVYWINGKDFAHVLPELDLTQFRVLEDTLFLLELLTRGFGNRVSQEFVFANQSVTTKKMKSDIWDNHDVEDTIREREVVEKMFPDFYSIVRDEEGNIIRGGFRDQGKVRVSWSKAFKSSQCNSLENFL